MTQLLIDLAKDVAAKHGLDPKLVCAVVEQESSWEPFAMRYEPGFMRHYVKPTLPEAPTTGEIGRATSWGLMQIMGQVAWEMGFVGKYYPELCDPSTGLEFGCRKLKECVAKRTDLVGTLLAYNGGGNWQYPDQVLARMEKY